MRGGAQRVSYDEEGDIFVLGAGVDAVGFRLDDIAIGQDDVLAVESFLAVSDGTAEGTDHNRNRFHEQPNACIVRCI